MTSGQLVTPAPELSILNTVTSSQGTEYMGSPHIAANMKMESGISFMKEVIINRNDNAPIYF